MTSDDRLHDVLHAAVDNISPSPPDWDDVRTRGDAPMPSHRTRRFAVLAAVAAVVVTVAVAAVVLSDDDARETRVINRPDPSTTVTTATTGTTAPTDTTVPTAAPAPATFVGTRDHSTRLVLADAATGRTIRVLADYGPYREPTEDDPIGGTVIDGIALTPDGAHVYFSTGPEPVVGMLHRVAIAGGPAEEIGVGHSPATSPAGDRLAFVLDDEVVVRDLATKAERRHRPKEGYPNTPMFSADGKHLVFTASESEYNELFVIDIDLEGPARTLDAEPRQGGEFYLSPSPRAYDNLMGFIETCCDVDATLPPQPTALVVVELPSGKVKGRLPLEPRMRRMDYDASGRHQLFVDEDGGLHRRSGGGLTRVAAGFTFADWQ